MGKSSAASPSTGYLPRQHPRKKINLHSPPPIASNPQKKIKIHSPPPTGPSDNNSEGSSSASPLPPLLEGYASLPPDVLISIAGIFEIPDLHSMSLVCSSWHSTLMPLWEAQAWLQRGKNLKQGVLQDQQKALRYFLEGVRLGSAACMVEAGLVYWESGEHEKGKELYQKAADMGYPAGQCNLALCYLNAKPSEPWTAIPLLYKASKSGCTRAQFYLANCLQRGHGVNCDISSAAYWYFKSAKGGFPRAMYRISLCYSAGQGMAQDNERSKYWLKRAADFGEARAQLDHGSSLLASGDRLRALYYLELASRAGINRAVQLRDQILLTISPNSRDRAMYSANKWKPVRHG